MTGTPEYADISSFQGAVAWPTYKQWAANFDGTARVAMKATEGVGFTDPRFQANRAGALAAGIDSILFYHYGRPDLNSAVDEANWLFHVVGNVRDGDAYMLDYEQNTSAATAQWAYDFLSRIESLTGKLPIIYASTSFIQAHLQGEPQLARYPLVLANWTYDPSARPACPAPWTSYRALQYSDKASIPGIAGNVDANVWLGSSPQGGAVSELLHFPMISQRDTDPNADFDCVPASLAACMQWLTGKPFTASEIKDVVYGRTYTGGTAATAYVDYCASHGVTLAPINGTGAALVTALHGALAEQHPCLITEPDPYAAGWSHVCAAYKCDAGSITVMDPWIDAPVTKSDAQWAAQLQFNQIWTLRKTMPIPTNWKDANNVLTAPNGVPVILGFRDHILQSASWDAGNQPCEAEYHTNSVLLHNPSVGAGTAQLFRDCLLWYTSSKGVVQEPFMGLELDAAYKFIAQLTQEIAALKAAQPTPAPQPALNVADAVTTLQDLGTIISTDIQRVLKDLGVSG